VLALPIKKICSLAGKICNEEVVSKLNDIQTNKDEDGDDPRWDKLKGIFK
jgi:uncharacterized metal-binding protein YceD (DUF177 family)